MRWVALLVLLVAFLGTARSAQLPPAYEAVGYATAALDDRVAALAESEAELTYDPEHGYLPSVLKALEIPPSSQTLVFTKTSFQVGLISPRTPRAIYFNDDAYVAWLPRGRALEVSAVDPDLGATFYSFAQKERPEPRFERQTFLCLRCHDSYSMTGGGVPRHMMGSAVPDRDGQPALHEGWYFTDDTTPIERRWGGWYVTGTHGDQRHLGNLVISSAADIAALDLDAGANVTDLSAFLDIEPYLVPTSDIVALLVLEHQVKVQNLITRVHYDLRATEMKGEAVDLESTVEPLVRAMLFADEAALTDEIRGTSGFTEAFENRGPFDSEGRSLRELELETRLFVYPLSYLVYSRSFDALPERAKAYAYRRFLELLEAHEGRAADLRIENPGDILAILEATKPDFAAARAASGGGAQ